MDCAIVPSSMVSWGKGDRRGTIREQSELHQSVYEGSSQFKFHLRSKDYDIILPGSTSTITHAAFFSYYIMKISSELEAVTEIRKTPSPIVQVRRWRPGRGSIFVGVPQKGGAGTRMGISKSQTCLTQHTPTAVAFGCNEKVSVGTTVYLDILREGRH